jgi:hypothetical protein
MISITDTNFILAAAQGGMTPKRVKLPARMLPNAAPLVPVKAKRPKHFGQCWLTGW